MKGVRDTYQLIVITLTLGTKSIIVIFRSEQLRSRSIFGNLTSRNIFFLGLQKGLKTLKPIYWLPVRLID
jgi:hypothetical protein